MDEDQKVQNEAERPATIEMSVPLEEMSVLTKYIAAGTMMIDGRDAEEFPRAVNEWLEFAAGLEEQGIIEL